MKHAVTIFAFASAVRLCATEVTIYPYTSQDAAGKNLVIQEYVTGETRVRPRKWTFSGATFSKRTVWDVPVGTNAVLEAYVDMNGNGRYDVTEPYGTNAGRDYPEIELSDASPETARIDLVNDTSSPSLTRDGVLASLSPSERADFENFFSGNFIADRTLGPGGDRVRIVRWLINNKPTYLATAEARVVFDKRFETDVRSCLTEADIMTGSAGFDLDWEHLNAEVMRNGSVISACGNVTNVSYLVVVGDGDTSWNGYNSSNTVHALKSVITRKFGDKWYTPIPLDPEVRDERVTLKWRSPRENFFTSYQILMTNTTARSHESVTIKRPARDANGVMTWMTGDLPSGEWEWQIRGLDSKFSDVSVNFGYTNCPPFTVQ